MTTKDEIRALLEVTLRGRVSLAGEFGSVPVAFSAGALDELTDVVAALLPTETETVEYRVVWPDGKAFGGYTESDWEADQDSDHDYRWQRHTIETTPWEDA